MSAAGDPIPPGGMWGAQNSPSWSRRSPLPRELGWAQVLLWVQFALTVLYVITVLSVVTYYSGEIFGILVYDSLPSVAGVYLARRLWQGGVWTSRALIGTIPVTSPGTYTVRASGAPDDAVEPQILVGT